MVFREERFFFWEGAPWVRDLNGFLLMFLKIDQIGMKMRGKVPELRYLQLFGPKVSDGESLYKIVEVSNDCDYVWLKPIQ